MTKKILILVVLTILIGSYFLTDAHLYLNLASFKNSQAEITAFQSENPLFSGLLFFSLYVLVTGLSLPGAALMTLIGGALFGLLWGTLIVSFASTIGATLAFLVARFLFRDTVNRRFGDRLKIINQGIEKDGGFYLFSLRLIPIFPFFIINLLMGLTPIKTRMFFFISQIGMLPGTLVFVNAGTEIAKLESLSGILSPGLLISFALLGLFPLLAKKTLSLLQARRVYQGFEKPRQFDRNLVVIGAGSAGLVSAYIASAVKSEVSLIEKNRMGGDCLNTGCVPSKALLRSAKFLSHIKRSKEFGIHTATVEYEFADVMQRVQDVIEKVEPHDSTARYTELGVECLSGEARILTPWTVEVNGSILSTKSIIIATGARPLIPPIEGLDQISYLTSDNLWELRECPRRLLVLGGGPIGCELSQAFARFGAEVTQVEMLPRLLIREDPEVSERLEQQLRTEGVDLRLQHTARRFVRNGSEQHLVCEYQGDEIEIAFDQVLIAVGRKANTTDIGLQELGIELNPNQTVTVNDYLQTRFPNIYACGDVAGPYQFTHTASHQAWYAVVNALFGSVWRFKVDYSVIPWATFTEPEIARVGLNELEAREQGVEFEVTRYEIDDLDRAIADQEAHGFIKVLTVPGKDTVIGATIVGEHASDLISEYITAMRHKLGMNKILGTIHIYPTLTEANKFAAGNWKRAHTPDRLLSWLKRFHRWTRR